jgi:hypothetical protein
MNAQRPAGHVPEEREAKHQQANSDVRGIRPSLPDNWRHADFERSRYGGGRFRVFPDQHLRLPR